MWTEGSMSVCRQWLWKMSCLFPKWHVMCCLTVLKEKQFEIIINADDPPFVSIP